ncbi:MAG TPA: carboxymuconolactone decarboxylase family protein [Anaerolineales bacterium]|nr:carboxymuconolactone decarboxylase family protein [Anaerolineales bacterium]
MTTETSLAPKEAELIAVGASIAAGCQPCTRFHFQAARAAGADDEEIRQAVRDALEVRSKVRLNLV